MKYNTEHQYHFNKNIIQLTIAKKQKTQLFINKLQRQHFFYRKLKNIVVKQRQR